MKQLTKLAQPFPSNWIEKAPGGHGDFINHAVINQRLLQIIGPFSFRVIREIYDGDRITGAVGELACEIDNQYVTVQEIGDADNLKDKQDAYVDKTNGAALKKASSDAFKRCAMRLGVGLELWSKDNYTLFDKLKAAEDEETIVPVKEIREDLDAKDS